jgi:hypothetical protein
MKYKNMGAIEIAMANLYLFSLKRLHPAIMLVIINKMALTLPAITIVELRSKLWVVVSMRQYKFQINEADMVMLIKYRPLLKTRENSVAWRLEDLLVQIILVSIYNDFLFHNHIY